MKKLFLLIGSALILTACHSSPDPTCYVPHQVVSPQGRLVAFGDSQTAGFRACLDGYAFSWAYQMANDLRFEIFNQAVPGSNFVSAQESGAIATFAFQPTDTVAMLIGYNDMANYGEDPIHLTLFQQTLTETLQSLGPQVERVLVGTCVHPYYFFVNASPTAVMAYRQATRAAVAAANLPNVAVFDADWDFAGNSEYYDMDDGVHINTKGQLLMGAVFESAYQVLLNEGH